MVEIIFAINDRLKGPQEIFYKSTTGENNEDLKLKVPIKAQLALSLTVNDSQINFEDAVLSFPDHDKISYTVLFPMDSKSGKITASISYIVSQSDHFILYEKIPHLKEKMLLIINQVQKWIYKPNSDLPSNIIEYIDENLIFDSKPVLKQTSPIKIITEKLKTSPDFLFKKITKNLEFVFFELYINRPIIIIGKSKISIEYTLSTLDFMIPNRNLRKIVYSDDFIDLNQYLNNIDVIGTSPVHEKKYKSFLIIDVDQFVVKGTRGKKPYFKNFIDNLYNQPLAIAEQEILRFTNHLDEQIITLESYIQQSFTTPDKLKGFLFGLNTYEREALIDLDISRHYTSIFWKSIMEKG